MNDTPSRWQHFMSHGMGRTFRHRDFVIYMSSGFFANIGIWVQRVGVQWLTWDLTHSYAWLGAVSFIDAIGIVLFMPIFGTLIDRSNRLKMMRHAQFWVTALSIFLSIFTLMHWMTIWWIVFAMAVHGVIDAFWSPARLAMTPSLVPRGDLAAAIGCNATMFNMAQILGPTAAGLIIGGFEDQVLGIGILFVITIVGSLIYMTGLYMLSMQFEEQTQQKAAPTGFMADMKEGLFYIFEKPGLGMYMGLMLMTTLFMRPFREQLAGYADGIFQAGPAGLAALNSAVGAGALIGALVVGNTTKVKGLTKLVLWIFGIGIVVQYAFFLAPNIHVATWTVAVLGTTIAIGGIGGQVLVQSSIHANMRGRVVSVWSIIMRAGPTVGAWVLGGLAEWTGLREAFVIATTIYLIYFIWMARRFKFLAQSMESPPEDQAAPQDSTPKPV